MKHIIQVEPKAQPLLNFLNEQRLEVGAMHADQVYANAADDQCMLCVTLTDNAALMKFRQRMRAAFIDQPGVIALCDRVMVFPGDMETRVVVFPEVAASHVGDEH